MQSNGKGVALGSNIILQSLLPEHLGEKTEKESHCLSKMNTSPPYISNANLHNVAKPQSEAGYENGFLAPTVFHKLMVWVCFFFATNLRAWRHKEIHLPHALTTHSLTHRYTQRYL